MRNRITEHSIVLFIIILHIFAIAYAIQIMSKAPTQVWPVAGILSSVMWVAGMTPIIAMNLTEKSIKYSLIGVFILLALCTATILTTTVPAIMPITEVASTQKLLLRDEIAIVVIFMCAVGYISAAASDKLTTKNPRPA